MQQVRLDMDGAAPLIALDPFSEGNRRRDETIAEFKEFLRLTQQSLKGELAVPWCCIGLVCLGWFRFRANGDGGKFNPCHGNGKGSEEYKAEEIPVSNACRNLPVRSCSSA